MSGADDGAVAPQGTTGEPERPTGTLELLRHVADSGPSNLSPLEARRILSYITDSERARATLRMQAEDAGRRAKQAGAQLIAYREAAAGREAELEAVAVRLSWRLSESRQGLPWALLEDGERLYRVGAGPDEWARHMGQVGAALLGGVR